MELDQLNWAILKTLQENARFSFAEIGRTVGLSAPAVAERVQKMEEAGVIKRFSVDLDLEKLGYTLKAIVTFKLHPGKMTPFLKLLSGLQEVYECNRITGQDCFYIKVAVKAPKDLERIIDKFVEFGEPSTSVILSTPIDYKVFKE